MSVTDLFDRGWRQNPSGIAFRMDDRSWTYDEAGGLSCAIGHALAASGLRPGAKVAVLSPNDPEAWLCVIGTWRAGMVWIPLNPADPVDALRTLVEDFDCELIFYHHSLATTVAAIAEGTTSPLRWVSLGETGTDVPDLHAWTAGRPTTPPVVSFDMDDVVAIPPTGGTTGRPKGAMNTHRSFTTACAHLMLAFHYDADQPIVNLAAAPMTHTTGLLSLPVTARGGTVVVASRPDPTTLTDHIERFGVTEVFLPPTVIYRLLDSLDGQPPRDFSSLRYLIYGSAPMSVDRLKQALEVFGPVMTGAYGQMESPGSIAYLRPEEHVDADGRPREDRLTSCGRPYPLISTAIRDADGRTLGPGATGEICVRGDTVMRGYYKAPEQTASTIVDGWLHTGDVGHLDAEGYLHITDRKKDMIVSGGFNVFPSEVEQVLWAHPAVADCAVVGSPHRDWGEAVTAAVELRPGRRAEPAELITWCRERLGGVRTPKRIDIDDELPRSPNGKVLKKDVRARYWTDVERRI